MPNLEETITSDPKIMLGKPVIKGTRITVEHILEKLAYGDTVDSIAAQHPQLTAEQVHAAVMFAAEVLRTTVVHSAAEVAP